MKLSAANKLLIVMIVALGLLIGLRLLDPSLAPSLWDMLGADALKTLYTPWFHLGPRTEAERVAPGLDITPILLLQGAIFLAILTIGARLARRFMHTRVLSHTSLDAGQRYSLANLFGYILFFFGLMVGLQTAGLNLSSLTFLGGAVGIGIGFGLQAIFNNFVSGLILLVEHPIRVGDIVEVGALSGEVMRIGGRSTWIKGPNNAVAIVPNSELVTGRVVNLTGIDHRARLTLEVVVPYGTDPEKVRAVLMNVARGNRGVLAQPSPVVVLARLGENGLRFELHYWTERRPGAMADVMSELNLGILKTFREEGIEVPAPQREVHVRTVPEVPPGRA